jgi:hypothetical protein
MVNPAESQLTFGRVNNLSDEHEGDEWVSQSA